MPLDGRRIAVAGGGLLGLALSLRLRALGARVVLLEAALRPGGLAGEQSIGGTTWDRFYHVILESDRHTAALLEELGLSDRMRWGRTRTGFYTDGTLHSMSDTVEFLRFPPLSLLDKLRLGGTIFLASRIRDWRTLERELAVDWLRRWSGPRVLERIWLPLLKSKLGENASVASAAFIWAIIARMYAARRSGLKEERFGYLDGGYAGVIDRLLDRVRDAGVELRVGARIDRIEGGPGGAAVVLADGTRLDVDHVVSTLPTPAFRAVCAGLSDAERARLEGIVYQGIVCPSLLLERPLSDFYVTNVTDRWVPFTGVIEMTALVDRARFGGRALVYLPIYLTQDSPVWQRDDASILDDCVAALERMYPGFDRSQVVDRRVGRARHVLAVSTLGYSTDAMPALACSVPNVFQLTSAQIAAGTLNVNETLGLLDARLPELLAAIAQRTPRAAAAEVAA